MQGLSRHSLGGDGCGSPEASKCGEGDFNAPLYPIGWSSPAWSPAEDHIDASQDKFGLCTRELADALGEQRLVQRNYL